MDRPAFIRPATAADLPAILAIFNEVIATSTAVFSLEPVTLDDRRTWFEARQQAGYPVLVAELAGDIAGFASFERVAHFREVGHKFGRWLDLVFVQRFLDPAGAAR